MASQWPPRSPHDVLLSTPGGRERMRRLAERQSPSPSPTKLRTSRSTTGLNSRAGGNELPDPFQEDMDMDEDDDDDEEMLELKLQALQAQMKLKKLQAAKAQKKAAPASSSETNGRRSELSTRDRGAVQGLPVQSKLAAARDRIERPPTQTSAPVQVPASPIRKAHGAADLPTSPQRILLGIDKGRKAAEMSLKRAPSMRAAQGDAQNQQGGYLRRSKTASGHTGQLDAPRPLSFNERLASVRADETTRQEKQQRIQQIRTKAFSIGKDEMEEYKTKAINLPDIPYKAPEYSREDILSGNPLGGLQRSSTTPALQSRSQGSSFTDDPFASPSTSSTAGAPESEASFESYSGLHLSKRILPHRVLTRAITGKKTYILKDLLRHVKAPDWSLPDVESDIVVFAIVANKSDPKSHRPGPGKDAKDRGKYMVINLVDLTFEVDLFLFNSGFDRFWKLTPGTVLAILNPTIMPPPQGREDTGRFGLVINSDEDTILEIGNSRDLGYCKSVKRDGNMCNTWVNIRRSEHCEFHTNEAVRKAREGRIEMNSTSFGGGERYKKNSREVQRKKDADAKKSGYDRDTQSHFFISGTGRAADLMDDEKVNGIVDRVEREDGLKRRLAQKEKERDIAKKLGEIGGGAGKEYMSRAASGVSSALGVRGKQRGGLGSSVSSASASGSGIGGETGASGSGDAFLPGQGQRWDARALGLVGKRGEGGMQHKVELGPLKRKRPESSASNSTASGGGGANGGYSVVGAGRGGSGDKGKNGNSGEAYGWGSTLRSKLTRMKDGERLDGKTVESLSRGGSGDIRSLMKPPPPPVEGTGTSSEGGRNRSPVRKKTRFVTERGIREAGRESLGEPLSAAAKRDRQVVLDDDDDDDDDLIVVK